MAEQPGPSHPHGHDGPKNVSGNVTEQTPFKNTALVQATHVPRDGQESARSAGPVGAREEHWPRGRLTRAGRWLRSCTSVHAHDPLDFFRRLPRGAV